MKILYVITGLGLGGAEKVVADLADQMVLRGHEVKIIYLTGPILVRPKSPIEIIGLNLDSIKDLKNASKKYRETIESYQPDVVHSHMVHANIFARINRLIKKIPKLICTAHSSNEGGSLRMFMYRVTNFLSNYNSNVSKKATQSFINMKAFTSKNLNTIYNGIDLLKFNSTITLDDSNDLIRCISVGRFSEPKDYPNLLKAIALVIQSIPNIHFNIAGEGELKGNMEQFCADLNIADHVSFLGRRDDIPELMNKSDLFILPSKYEGFGLVVAEAMACGTFVVATDCGGVKEVMGGNGILVPPQDSEQLAKAIITALSMPHEEVIENNKKAKQHVSDNFDLVKIVDQWEKIYEE